MIPELDAEMNSSFNQVYLTLSLIKKYASLTKEELSQEKKKLLEGMILPWCVLAKEGKCSLITDDIFKYYDQYYKNEEYYIAGKSKLKEILGV